MAGSWWPEVRYFDKVEFDSPDAPGSGSMMRARVVFMLDALRGLLGRPMPVNSGYRTKNHNAKVGGAPASAHTAGEAVDIGTRGWTKAQREQIVTWAIKLGFNGIGIGATFIHLDIKQRRASWRYSGSKTIAVPVGKELEYL